MKILITESQFVDLFFKRQGIGRIETTKVDEKNRYYPPCDYTERSDLSKAMITTVMFVTQNIDEDGYAKGIHGSCKATCVCQIDVVSETPASNSGRRNKFYDKVSGKIMTKVSTRMKICRPSNIFKDYTVHTI
jgi:hypothetical protein